MRNTPINHEIVTSVLDSSGLKGALDQATIREIVRLVNEIEKASGVKFIRMEMGIPGLEPPRILVDAEIEAIKNGVISKYPMIEGISELKDEASRFARLFMNLDIPPKYIVPTVGSMQAGFTIFMISQRLDSKKNKVLFIDPGFPVQKQQCEVLGIKYDNFDVYNYRGKALRAKLEEYLSTGEYSTLIYSSPNNPTWIVFTEEELQIIGDVCNKYDVIAIEDMAYFAMDFRYDYSRPGQPPYPPTVAKYTGNYVLMFSSSKLFSFAGERIGLIYVSPVLFDKNYPYLKNYYKTDEFGYSLIYGALYALSAGVNHSAQVAFARMLKAVNDGQVHLTEPVKEYAERACVMKKLFTENGFYIVYDKDVDKPVGDGFYFTLHYRGMTTNELLEKLLYYGISAISLKIAGSEKEGLRACVSQVLPEQFPVLEQRLKQFHNDYPKH